MDTRSGDAYDRDYFDKWYRNPRYRVKTSRELARQATFVVSESSTTAMGDWQPGAR